MNFKYKINLNLPLYLQSTIQIMCLFVCLQTNLIGWSNRKTDDSRPSNYITVLVLEESNKLMNVIIILIVYRPSYDKFPKLSCSSGLAYAIMEIC